MWREEGMSWGSREMGELQKTRSLGAVLREKDEELALFLEMRRREKERGDSLLVDLPVELALPPGSKPGCSPIFKIPTRSAAVDDILNSDLEKNDYDWLLTPPGTPLFPSLEKESDITKKNITPKARATMLKSRLANPSVALQKDNPLTKQVSASAPNVSTVGIRRPLSSGGSEPISVKLCTGSVLSSRSTVVPGSISSKTSDRSATPTGRLAFSVASKSSRSSTPTAKAAVHVKTTGLTRSTTPTPTLSNLVAPLLKSSSRGPTPPRQPSAPTNAHNSGSNPSQTKSNKVASKGLAPPHSSPAVESIFTTSKTSELISRANGTKLNSTSTEIPERPILVSRGRSAPHGSRSLSADPTPGRRIRRQSCSPSRGRDPNCVIQGRLSVPAIVRTYANNDDVNPILVGTKMVERVINARRLAPPKQDRTGSSLGKTTPDSSGFGRTLSKKSLDMAIRHMGIRQYSK